MTETLTTDYVVADVAPIVCDVAADIGNARAIVLVRSAERDVPIATIMPAVRSLHGAFSADVLAARGHQPGTWSALGSDEHVIERDGIERFLGRLAIEHAPAASSGRGSDARYYDGTTADFLLAGVAAALPAARTIKISRLVTMLPISLWHLAPKVEAALRGRHSYRYNGRDLTVTIASVQVQREAEAAFATLDGDTSGPILVIDGGGRTVNVAMFNGGVYRAGVTLDNMGVEATLDSVDKALIGRGARALTLAERGALLDRLVRGEPYSVMAGNAPVVVSAIARQQFDATAAALVQELYAKVRVEQAGRIVFVGGAAYGPLFGDAVRRLLPIVQVGAMPELANAYGALGTAQPTKRRKR